MVGTAVVRHLVASGVAPVALSRSESSDAALAAIGAQPVRGDVLDEDSLRAAFDGAEVVFHVAGVNEMCARDPHHMMHVNVDGSVAVMRAANAAGVRRVVHTSSAAAIGEERGTVGTESSVHRGSYLSAYERSKHLSELAVFAEAGSVEVVSVNPSSVQGPGRASGTGKLILDVANGRLPVLIDTPVSIVDIDDCARGHLLAAATGRPGSRYLLNSFTTTVAGALAEIEDVLGRELRVRFLPGWVASGAGAVIEGAFRLIGRTPPVCREMVRTLRHGHRYDGSLAVRELGLRYTSERVVLERLFAWFRAEGLLGDPGRIED